MGTSSGKFSARRETLTYRQHFAARWSKFIRATFESPEQAAHEFGVGGDTATNWWDGHNAPSGFVVSLAYQRHFEAATCYLRSMQ